jgi:capsular polysaccharide transport system permease protein
MDGSDLPRGLAELVRAASTEREPPSNRSLWGRLAEKARANRWFLAVVVAPTLVTALYYFGIAAKQYESEAHFMVRAASSNSAVATGGLAQVIGLAGGTTSAASESYSVGDYLTSHDAVAALQNRLNLVSIFRRPEADFLSELRPSKPSAERLLKYYRNQVVVNYSPDTGITTVKVHAFRPEDARAVAETMLQLGEERVNALNRRALENAVANARNQLSLAENAVQASQGGLTQFRQSGRDVDPDRTSIAGITLLGGLKQQLDQGRAQLATLGEGVRHDSPQYIAAKQRVDALAAQVAAESSRLAGSPGAVAQGLGRYEGLRLRQDFAAKRYESAAASLQAAQEQAIKQQLYVVRVVEPNLPEKSLFPERWLIVATVGLAALLIYGFGWLIAAGIREHAV